METLNIRHETRAVFLDISQAFDTVCHPALLSKLSAMESKAISTLRLLTSSTVVANVWLSMEPFFSPLPVMVGVPQGSALGPILFLIFINYLTDSLESPLFLFADDSPPLPCHPSSFRQAGCSRTG